MKCKVCDKHVNLNKKNRYEIRIPSFGFERPTIYEAFDCPHCGCQNIVNIREDIRETKE